MEPKDQVKTIMDIFVGLDHENQVSLFKEIKSALLTIRAGLIEKHCKDVDFAQNNIQRLRDGNEEIHGNVPTVTLSKASY